MTGGPRAVLKKLVLLLSFKVLRMYWMYINGCQIRVTGGSKFQTFTIYVPPVETEICCISFEGTRSRVHFLQEKMASCISMWIFSRSINPDIFA